MASDDFLKKTAFFLAAALLCTLSLNARAAGFTQWQSGGLTVGVWYPATAQKPMTLADYYSDRGAFETFMSGAGVSAETIRAYMNTPMRAQRDARKPNVRLPLILIGQGNGHSFADQAVLCEFLADHGYLVATTPSPMLETPITSEDDIGKFAELQASQLARAVDVVAKRFRVDTNRLGFVGHSFGPRAGLLLAMNDPRVKALVSLDGGIGTALGADSMKRTASYKPGRVPPLLHVYQGTPDFTFLRAAGPESLHTERIEGLQHVHFSTLGYAAASLPELARITRGGDDMSATLQAIADRTLRFLDRHVR